MAGPEATATEPAVDAEPVKALSEATVTNDDNQSTTTDAVQQPTTHTVQNSEATVHPEQTASDESKSQMSTKSSGTPNSKPQNDVLFLPSTRWRVY